MSVEWTQLTDSLPARHIQARQDALQADIYYYDTSSAVKDVSSLLKRYELRQDRIVWHKGTTSKSVADLKRAAEIWLAGDKFGLGGDE